MRLPHVLVASLRRPDPRRSRARALQGVVCGVVGALLAGAAAAGDDLTLYRKALLFDADMEERFLHEGQLSPKLRLPTPDRPFVSYNMPDNAYMTGLYCASQCWRYALTGDPHAKELARAASRALNHLQTVTGRPGLLARAAVPIDRPWLDDGVWHPSPDGRFRWRGDVSSDQVDGVMFGYYVYFTTVATEAEEPRIADHVGALVGAIVEAGLRIVDVDGNVTTWGHYYPEYVRRREPMNALLMLQMLKVAAFITGERRFEAEYRRLIETEGYAEIAERARALGPPERVNHSDDVLIMIALYPLLELEREPAIRTHYLKAAERWFHGSVEFPGVAPEANPLATFFYHHWTGKAGQEEPAIRTLRLMPLDMKWNRPTIDRYAERFGFEFDPAPASPPPTPGAPAPIDRREKTWSFLVQNPYRAAGERHEDSGMEYQGLDYTLSYWFGAAHGMIPEDARLRTPADAKRARSGDDPEAAPSRPQP